ncbi:MAG: NB-ARC domain-containing protein [Pseudonocardiaceae bacterium]
MLTLTGVGGCGKTRLALQAAADAMDRHPDGVWWVELARLEDATLLPAAVIGALGLREVPGRALFDTLVEFLCTRRALVVLDNCEHLLACCAQLADALLRACPSLTILATSRAPLGVPGEVTWRVPSMSLRAEAAGAPIETLHWMCLGWEAVFRGRLDDACELLARSIAASDEVGDPATNGFASGRRGAGDGPAGG